MRHGNYLLQKLKTVTLVLTCLLLASCFGGGDKIITRYYLVDPIDNNSSSLQADNALSIEIIDVHIPQYLDRFHIATRDSANSLQFSESHQWAENLRENLMRTMARNLSTLLSTSDISTSLMRSSSLPDYRLLIYIEQFELDIDGKVKLSARWQLTGTKTTPLGIHNADFISSLIIEDGDYEQMVITMRELYGELSNLIAESILAEENKS